MSAIRLTFTQSTRRVMSTTTTRATRTACPSAFAFDYRLDKVTRYAGEINVFAKGVYDLSVWINIYLDVVNRTLLALPSIAV